MDLLIVTTASFLLVVLAFVVLVNTSHTSIIDFVWCLGVTAAGIFYAIYPEGEITSRGWHIIVLHLLWFSRLGGMILYRTLVLEKEDGRYRRLRDSWGDKYRQRLFRFYLFQGVGITLFSLPAWSALQFQTQLSAFGIFGGALCLVGTIGAFASDWTLTAFRNAQENAGQVCRTGLWRYSRHPNFFFEWLYWLGLAVLGFDGLHSIWIFVFPVMVLIFLLFITGVPTVEAQALRSREQAYREYQQTTSVFIPWFPKTLPEDSAE
tara:strand:+ start:269 stop:1060 length:792 start_codon:yes stop_codon:yes gene_type:complete